MSNPTTANKKNPKANDETSVLGYMKKSWKNSTPLGKATTVATSILALGVASSLIMFAIGAPPAALTVIGTLTSAAGFGTISLGLANRAANEGKQQTNNEIKQQQFQQRELQREKRLQNLEKRLDFYNQQQEQTNLDNVVGNNNANHGNYMNEQNNITSSKHADMINNERAAEQQAEYSIR